MTSILQDVFSRPALIFKLLKNVIEIIFVLHDVQHKSKHMLIDRRHNLVKPFRVNQNDLYDVRELLMIHLIHELFLLSL